MSFSLPGIDDDKVARALDSGAIHVTVGELIRGPSDEDAYVHQLMDPRIVPAMLVFYLVGKVLFDRICASLGTTGKSFPFRVLALIHNLLLCLFSAVTALQTWTITAKVIKSSGFVQLSCSTQLWDNGIGVYGFAFYLSKYWELLDTALLIVKRRKPSFLAVYHHAMTFCCAYMLQASQAPATYLFVGLNSVVHTVMYAYYAFSCIGIRVPGKSGITGLQLVQFVIGEVLVGVTFFLKDGKCMSEAQKVAVGAMMLHVAFLIYLFLKFFHATYLSKVSKVKSKAQ